MSNLHSNISGLIFVSFPIFYRMQKTKAEQNLRVNMLQGPDMASGGDEEAEDENPGPQDGSKSERGLIAKMKGRLTDTSCNLCRIVACEFACVLKLSNGYL